MHANFQVSNTSGIWHVGKIPIFSSIQFNVFLVGTNIDVWLGYNGNEWLAR